MRSKKRPGAGGGRGEGEEETFGIETEQSTGGAELISFTPAPRRRLSSGRHAGGAPRVPRGRRSATTATQRPAAAPSAELRRLRTATRSREPLGGGDAGERQRGVQRRTGRWRPRFAQFRAAVPAVRTERAVPQPTCSSFCSAASFCCRRVGASP